MHQKELLLQADSARAEAARAKNPYIRNAFLEIQRWYERLALMEAEGKPGIRDTTEIASPTACEHSALCVAAEKEIDRAISLAHAVAKTQKDEYSSP
jgi:hypothetical protein